MADEADGLKYGNVKWNQMRLTLKKQGVFNEEKRYYINYCNPFDCRNNVCGSAICSVGTGDNCKNNR